jgi:uncharacterized membrane protein
MYWTDEKLADLPLQKGFRLRGAEMTRLETFADAAFAFATTLLVIAGGTMPNSLQELTIALKGIPTFAASFASIASFWVAHRKWSRRYGMEDTASTVISLCLIFVMLVFVYPLKMVFSALFNWVSGGWFPTSFVLHEPQDLLGLFMIYGAGFAALTAMLSLLYVRALRRPSLNLDAFERIKTREEVWSFAVLAATGLLSALMAWVCPPRVAIFAGFAYCTLVISMPLVAIYYDKKAEPLKTRP